MDSDGTVVYTRENKRLKAILVCLKSDVSCTGKYDEYSIEIVCTFLHLRAVGFHCSDNTLDIFNTTDPVIKFTKEQQKSVI
jgi:hypothetical protein